MQKLLFLCLVASCVAPGIGQTIQSVNRLPLSGPTYSSYEKVQYLPDGTSIVAGTVGYDRVVAKYDFSGNLLWSQQNGGPTSGAGTLVALNVDSNGNSYVISSPYHGSFQKSTIMSYSPTGTLRWSKLFDIGAIQVSAVSSTGNLYVASRFATQALSSRVLAINGSGTVLWTSEFGANSGSLPASISVSGSKVYVSGTGDQQNSMVKTYDSANGGLLGTLTLSGSIVKEYVSDGSNGYGIFYDSVSGGSRVFKAALDQYATYASSNLIVGYPAAISLSGNEIYCVTQGGDRLVRLNAIDLSITSDVQAGSTSTKIVRSDSTTGFINHRGNPAIGYFNGNSYTSISSPNIHSGLDLTYDSTFGLISAGTGYNDASLQWFTGGTTHIRSVYRSHSGNVPVDSDAIPHAAIDREGHAYYGATMYTQLRRFRLFKLFRNGTVAWEKNSPGALERLEGIAPTSEGNLFAVESGVGYIDLVRLNPTSGADLTRNRLLATNDFNRRPIAMSSTPGYVDMAFGIQSGGIRSLRVVRARSGTGQLYFNKGLAVAGQQVQAMKILYRPNGDIVVGGHTSTSQVYSATMLACFASNGVLKWNKTIVSPPTTGSNPNSHTYGDFTIDSAGNILLLSYDTTISGSMLKVTKFDGSGSIVNSNHFGSDFYAGYGSIGVSPKDGRIVVFSNYSGVLRFINPTTLAQSFETTLSRIPTNLSFDKSGTLFLGIQDTYVDSSGVTGYAQAILKVSETGVIQSTRRVAGTQTLLSATLTKILPGIGNDMWMSGTIATQNQGIPLSMSRLIQPANPVGVPDSYIVNATGTTTIGAPGLLANDSDPNGDTLTAVLTTAVPTALGTVVVNSNGSFRFTPRAGFHGVTTFKYKAKDYDGYLSPETTVTITVP